MCHIFLGKFKSFSNGFLLNDDLFSNIHAMTSMRFPITLTSQPPLHQETISSRTQKRRPNGMEQALKLMRLAPGLIDRMAALTTVKKIYGIYAN